MAMKEIGYQDERMADGTVCRRFDERRTEWRTRLPDERVGWRDASGATGTDELLGDGVIKRTHGDGRVEYARDQGFGRTAWANETVTINRTPVAGGTGAGLAAVAVTAAFLAPPLSLTAGEEEALRRRRADAGSVEGGDIDFDGWGEDKDDEGEDDFG